MDILILIIGVMCTLLCIAYYVIKHHLSIIKYSRSLERNKFYIDEEIEVAMNIENRSKLPVPFLYIIEYLPKNISIIGRKSITGDNEYMHYKIVLTINKMERLKRLYKIKASKRGVYFIEKTGITIGDQFGLLELGKKVEDPKEIIVYPNFKKATDLKFINNSLSGDQVVKRWIFDDPLMIKGIREYTVNHRMKDIHWNSSIKANKLMVKEYDYTSEREVVVIFNVQCGEPSYLTLNKELVEEGISLSMTIADYCVQQAINTSFWTNSGLNAISVEGDYKTKASAYNVESMLEMAARVNGWTRKEFNIYLKENMRDFNSNSLYIIVTPFLDNESINTLCGLSNKGIDIKIIDISINGIKAVGNLDLVRYSEGA